MKLKSFLLFAILFIYAGIVFANNSPSISNISPLTLTTIASGSTYQIHFSIDDLETTGMMKVELFYSSNYYTIWSNVYPKGTNSYLWDTTGVPTGTYFIYGRVTDSSNVTIENYSLFPLTISNTNTGGGMPNTPPSISNISPLTPITVASGESYPIEFFIYDFESGNMKVDLFYNTAASLIGATFISSNYYPNGTNSTYPWGTTGVSAGNYYIIGMVTDSSNAKATNYSATTLTISNTNTGGGMPNNSPSISNISPLMSTTIASGENYNIGYTVYDAESTNMLVNLYYNTSQSISGATLIISSNSSTNGVNWHLWNTTGVLSGSYYVIGMVTDSSNASATNYSSAILTISNTNTGGGMPNNLPSISNISPLSSVTVASGESYPIDFFIFDLESGNMKVDLFYNTAASLIGATFISSNYYPNGTNSTYPWNTTGVSSGSYYVIGMVTDSSNASATNYSSAILTISNTNTGGGMPNNLPSISNISPLTPVTIASGESYPIDFFIFDLESGNMKVDLFYNTAASLIGATFISSNYYPNGTNSTYPWNTTGVSSGSYYVIGMVTDSSNASATNYSPAILTISNTNTGGGMPNNLPSISNISPLTPVTVASGNSYLISFNVMDIESPFMMVDLYYNSSQSIAGATIITQGSGATNGMNNYLWDTAGVSTGSYYIVSVVIDSSNASATNYSAATITLIVSNTNGPQDTTPPAVPSGLKITAGDKQLTLTWNRNLEGDFKEYYVYRKAPKDQDYKIIATTVINAYIDDKLKNGSIYYYKLRAIDNDDNVSEFSSSVQGMPIKDFKHKGNLTLSDNKITPDDPRELYINITPKDNDNGEVAIYIYDISMKLVKKINVHNLSAGQNLYKWTLKNSKNIDVPTGVYFIYVKGSDWKTYKKVYIIK